MKNVLADMPATAATNSRQPKANPYTASRPAPPANTMQSVSGDEQGTNPAPTRAGLQPRSASPVAGSGMEQSMHTMADKLHPVGKR